MSKIIHGDTWLEVIINFFKYLLGYKEKTVQIPTPIKNYPQYQITDFDIETIDEINQFRLANNKPKLVILDHLCSIAWSHSVDMKTRRTADHLNSDERFANYPNNAMNEIVAYNFSTPGSFVYLKLQLINFKYDNNSKKRKLHRCSGKTRC